MSIRFKNVTFGYSERMPILHRVDLSIEEGESVLMAGPNGAGKSTVLKLMNGILKPQSGSVMVDDLDTIDTTTPLLASHVAVTFQNPAHQIFARTVRREVLFGPTILHRINANALADESMELFHLTKDALKHPYDLSPAHRKLLTIASAVATDAPYLAFDEPTASLSQPERLVLLNAMDQLRSTRRTLVIVSHDLDFFIRETSKLIIVNAGRIVHVGKPVDIIERKDVARASGISIPLSLRLQQLAIQHTPAPRPQ